MGVCKPGSFERPPAAVLVNAALSGAVAARVSAVPGGGAQSESLALVQLEGQQPSLGTHVVMSTPQTPPPPPPSPPRSAALICPSD